LAAKVRGYIQKVNIDGTNFKPLILFGKYTRKKTFLEIFVSRPGPLEDWAHRRDQQYVSLYHHVLYCRGSIRVPKQTCKKKFEILYGFNHIRVKVVKPQ